MNMNRAHFVANDCWPTKSGYMLLATMPGPHLINALLKALERGDPEGIADRLALWVKRRGLVDAAIAEVERREAR